ncbi:unnamed protein product [Aphanomyces euteiches]|nr:hypothetical protein AeRB84_017000 [Aphanomyces euteiches]
MILVGKMNQKPRRRAARSQRVKAVCVPQSNNVDQVLLDTAQQPGAPEEDPADAMILQYFMDFTSDEKHPQVEQTTDVSAAPEKDDAALQKLRERQNKHRLNNIRHRQRKQSENDALRMEVVELEVKLQGMKALSESRKAVGARDEAAIRRSKEVSMAEKRKRVDAEEEHKILTNTIQSHRDLLQLYFKRITTSHCLQSDHLILENEPFLMYTLMGCDDVRHSGCDWIMTQMRRKTDVALTYLHSYVGNHIEEDTKIYLGENTVDLVRNHTWSFPVLQVAQSSWDSFTRVNVDPNALRKTSRLEDIDANTCYTRITIEDGIVSGRPLTLNMLQSRFMDGARAVIAFRTISEDTLHPLEGNGLCDLSVAGWLSFEPNPDGTTHARVFVKFRTDHSNGEVSQIEENIHDNRPNRKTQANQWIMSVISKMFTAVNGSARQALRTPPPATTSITFLKKTERLKDMSA